MMRILSILKQKKVAVLTIILIAVAAMLSANSTTKVKTVPVKVVSVEKRVVTKTVSASGQVKSKNQADLAFAAGQRISKLYAIKGQQVKKGQLLAVLENQNLVQTVQSYKDARDVVLRERELFILNESDNKNTLGGSEQYSTRLRQYDEEVSQAEALYKAQLALLGNTFIYAPFEGTIIDTLKKEGEIVVAAETVIKLADLQTLEFEVELDQEDFAQLKVDMEAEINLDAFANQTFKGKIINVPKYISDADAATLAVKIDFINLSNVQPVLGMTGDAKIVTQTTGQDVDALYYDQIYTDEEAKPYVWVLDKGYVSKYTVETGLEGDIYTQIKSTIDKQIIVPLTSDIEVKDGYKAKIVK